jgi:hypothetical protein
MSQSKSQGERTVSQRNQAQLGSRLEKRMLAYAAAAGAAGVGLLAMVPSAEAKIVYTSTNAVVTPNGYTLDLNNDGIADFYLVHGVAVSIGNSERFSYLEVCHVPENNTLYNCVSSTNAPIKDNGVRLVGANDAAALAAGSKIADGEKFQQPGVPAGMIDRAYYPGTSRTQQNWAGPWANGGAGVRNRYLGFKFKIDGQFHYGWARLSVVTTAHSGYTATLTGYAYETTPNKGIVAGQKSGPDEVGALEPAGAGVDAKASYRPASLGMLARGAAEVSIWRREDSPGM